jgi:hypothetical protein
MRLFTPVSSEEASLLEGGVALSSPLYWVDRQVPEEADEDAIWVVSVIPDEEIAPFEQDSRMGYREFVLPPVLPSRYPVKRVDDQ